MSMTIVSHVISGSNFETFKIAFLAVVKAGFIIGMFFFMTAFAGIFRVFTWECDQSFMGIKLIGSILISFVTPVAFDISVFIL